MCDSNDSIAALIERLRLAETRESEGWGYGMNVTKLNDEAANGLVRLQEINVKQADRKDAEIELQGRTIASLVKIKAELEAEIAKLREALEEIADLPDVRSDERSQIARAALGGNDENR